MKNQYMNNSSRLSKKERKEIKNFRQCRKNKNDNKSLETD
jgi:hypothetical protein